MARWRAQLPFNDSSLFAERLAAEGLTENRLLEILSIPAQAYDTTPEWLNRFAGAYSQQAVPASSGFRHELAGFLRVAQPLIESVKSRLESEVSKLCDRFPDAPFTAESGSRLLLSTLPNRLLEMLNRTLVLELNIARLEDVLEGDTPADRFESFLNRLGDARTAAGLLADYPVLARQLITTLDLWLISSLEVLTDLAHDVTDIRETLAKDIGTLVNLTGDLSDRHDGGRTVHLLEFSSGQRLIYKPKPLAADKHFQDLLVWLNERGANPPLRPTGVLDKGNHGWVEFIEPRNCESEEEVRRFYQRQGAFIAILYVLHGVDFHFENLRAFGEHPVLIDLEALFHPRHDRPENADDQRFADDPLSHSVLRIGLLPTPYLPEDEEAAGGDLSGLGSTEGQLTNFEAPICEKFGTDEMRYTRGRVEMQAGDNQPRLNDKPASALDYAASIAAGFENMYRLLLEHRESLLAPGGPVMAFERDVVRVILRSTRCYALLLDESYHPDFLHDAMDRERLLDRLWVGARDFPYLRRALASERRQLQEGDIPIFRTIPASRDLWHGDQVVAADFFGRSGMELVRERIASLGEQDLAQQSWYLRASLATLASTAGRVQWLRSAKTAAIPEATPERLVAAARRIGDRLETLGRQTDRYATWMGLDMRDERSSHLAPLGPDLYDGTAGVALFLAQLAEMTGEGRYRALAEKAVELTRDLMDPRRSTPTKASSIGGFSGAGGQMYLLSRLAVLWDDPALLQEAEEWAQRAARVIDQDEHLDIMGGAAGCIGGLLALYSLTGSRGVCSTAIQCGDWLLRRSSEQEQGIAWENGIPATKPLTGFSHGAAGIAWALMELASVSGERRFHDAALAGIAYERSVFSREAGNWPDYRQSGRQSGAAELPSAQYITAWCHGAAGIGLARLRALRHSSDPALRADIDLALRVTLVDGFGFNHSLCHGDLGNIELLLEAGRSFDPFWAPEAARLSAIILDGIDRNGALCGNPLKVESPGLMTGISGIGYELLRIAAPERVPSVLVLAAPREVTLEAGEVVVQSACA
jgi:type 2 lantibiotic biosynthesis protein LanM